MKIKLAILFYSQRNPESIKLKDICENYNLSIEYISLDNKKIRKRLKENNVYSIEHIPSILLLYENKDYEVLDGNDLYNWIEQLIQNINALQYQEQEMYRQQMEKQLHHQQQTSLDLEKNDTKHYEHVSDTNDDLFSQSHQTSSIKLNDMINLQLNENPNQDSTQMEKKDALMEKKQNLDDIKTSMLNERKKISQQESKTPNESSPFKDLLLEETYEKENSGNDFSTQEEDLLQLI